MSDVVTVSERKARETLRRRSAAASVMSELREFGHTRGGKFIVFGSAAEGRDRMRHRVRHSDYDEFVPRKAEPSVEAAKRIISRIRPAIAAFKKKVDPEPGEENDGGDGAGGGSSGGPPV